MTLRTRAMATLASVAVFLVLFVLAVRAYPGGTDWDRATVGHQFWANYLCDLTRGVALNGAANPLGSLLAQAGTIVLALGLFPLWWLLPHFFPSRFWLGMAVRFFGSIGAAGAIAVTLLPSDRFGSLHTVAIVLAGPPGLLAALLAIAGLTLEKRAPRILAAIGGAMLATGAVDFVLYVTHLDGNAPVIVAVLERVTAILLVGWMATASLRALRIT